MLFALNGSRNQAGDGRRKCESSTFAIVSRDSQDAIFTSGALLLKRSCLLTSRSSLRPMPAKGFRWLNSREPSPNLFHWENSHAMHTTFTGLPEETRHTRTIKSALFHAPTPPLFPSRPRARLYSGTECRPTPKHAAGGFFSLLLGRPRPPERKAPVITTTQAQ